MVITTDAMDIAAESKFHAWTYLSVLYVFVIDGQLDVVAYLSENRFEGCTTEAMDMAATNGHVQVLQYLRAHRPESCTEKAFDQAAGNGHLAVLDWLLQTYHTPQEPVKHSSRALDLAAANGKLDVLLWINKCLIHHPINPISDLKPTRAAFDQAAGNGHLNVLKYLLATYDNLISITSIELAARNGHVVVLQWLMDNYKDMFAPELAGFDYVGSTSSSMSSPVKPKYVHVMDTNISIAGANKSSKRLKTSRSSNYSSSPLAEAFSMAIRYGKVNTVLWLHKRLGCIPTDEDLDWAARNGHLTMMLYLLQNFSDYARPTIKALEWYVNCSN